MRFRCNSCQGTYEEMGRDGARYFHACAPIPDPTLEAPATPDDPDTRQLVEREDHRDENIIDTPGPDFGRPRAPGLGREPFPPIGAGPP